MRIICMLFLLMSAVAEARSLEGVEFANTATVSGETLKLNGLGLRSKRKLFMNFKVYVAGLYAETTSKSADEG